jgi:hypothetical protein
VCAHFCARQKRADTWVCPYGNGNYFMSTPSSAIVQRLWNYCTVLRDDGLSYGDYVEQLTYLLFLKMDDERRKIGDPSTIPDAYSWAPYVP